MDKGFCKVAIEELKKAPWNYKQDDEVLLGKLVENIKRNGQVENIIVRELEDGSFEVVNGNHRYDAMIALSFDDVMVFNLGEVSMLQAKRIALETNESRFESDGKLLAGIISDVVEEFTMEDVVETTPFSESEIHALIDFQAFEWEEEMGAPTEGVANDKDKAKTEALENSDIQEDKSIICPHCLGKVILGLNNEVKEVGA